MHSTTYEYLKPTDAQMESMSKLREAAKVYNDVLDAELPDGPDKTFVIRAHRSNAMWANYHAEPRRITPHLTTEGKAYDDYA